MKERLQEYFRRGLGTLLAEAGDTGDLPEFALDTPRSSEHGDFACNAAMLLAKRLRRPPRAIAEQLVEILGDADGLIDRAEVAGPGFVNVWLAEARWQHLLREVLERGARFGTSAAGAGVRVQVEFVSANPTGPLTLGHGRQAVLGDCIARLLQATGHEATREYYFNDAGRQMRVLGQSVKARYLEQLGRAAPPTPALLAADPKSEWPETLDGLPIAFPRDGYQGTYIGEIAATLRSDHGESLVDEGAEGLFRSAAQELIFADIRRTLAAVGVEFDVYSNEKILYDEGRIEEVLAELRERDLVYDAEEAVWLRATAFGLDRDRVLVRRTGEPTYLLPDIAYHCQKFRRGFDRVIDVLGADHIEQFPFVRAAAGALGCPEDRIELVMHQFVTLTRGGQQVKQSTRRATFITVDELLEEVGCDVFRFFMVQRRAEGHLDFDLALAAEVDWTKNPAYYLQYAHARSCGIERKAAEQGIAIPDAESVSAETLTLPEEIDLLKKMAEFPDVVARASQTREPHHLAYYLRELAGLWNPYLQDGTRHRVLSEDAPLASGRLGLARAVRIVLGNALALLGVTAPERM